uniref:ribosomal protein S1 n=1 Tax=Chroothece richteriana TaxID=101928 RepID=UPI001FCD9084|nr:ribosomal protein S1 [Chroothece richteriana]UNJ14304.1 ribosomal protein S1 [Chroothece richteriana]
MCEKKQIYNFTYNKFTALINKYQYNFHNKDIVAGSIFSIESRHILVDIGAPHVAFLPLEEVFSQKIDNMATYLNVGQVFELYILLVDYEHKQIILSFKKVNLIKSWKRIQQLYTENIILNTRIMKLNKGGYIVTLEGLKGFVPKSHLLLSKSDLNINIDNIMPAKILEFNEHNNYLLLSFKCAYMEKNPLIFKLGNIIKGQIESIQPYGLFVNIYSIQGLLHISEIIENNTSALEKQFQIGQIISVMIIHIDNKNGKLTLSQKRVKEKV